MKFSPDKFIIHIKNNFLIYLILLTALMLRLLFISPYLEDWDSVQFALALHDFSIVKHQPHPPGYPLYVLIGKWIDLFFNDPAKSLGLFSAFLGAATTIPIFLLTKKMFDQITGIVAALLLMFIPVEWMLSEVALTNIPGLFFISALALLIFNSSNNYKLLLLSSFLSGLVLGVRFTEAPILITLLGIVVVKQKLQYVLPVVGLFFLGLGVWIIPLIVVTGLNEFTATYEWIAKYIVNHDSLLGQSSPVSFLPERLKALWYLLKVSYTKYFIILGFLSILLIFTQKSFRYQWRYIFLTAWLLSYLLPLIFIYNLEVPRYTLPLSAPLSIIITSILINIAKRKLLLLPIFISLALVLFNQSWSQVTRSYKAVPPTIAAVNYIKRNFNSKEVVVVVTFTYRQFQYYAPGYQVYYGDNLSTTSISPDKKVIIDYYGLKEKVANSSNLDLLETKNFAGDKDIFPRLPVTNLYILGFNKH